MIDTKLEAELENFSKTETLLTRLGQKIKQLRKQQDLTIKELAQATGLSLRFMAQLEAGEGNIAVSRLAQVAQALGVSLLELLIDVEVIEERRQHLGQAIYSLVLGLNETELEKIQQLIHLALGKTQHKAVALLGLRGAGKTTIGSRLARILSIPFWELDERIEDMAGLTLTEIFTLHGEAYYRRLEAQALLDLFARDQRAVIALPGGIVNNSEVFGLIKQQCVTIWLRAAPTEHMQRVLAQGDRRPIANRPNAMTELRTILAAREPLYSQAEITIDTTTTDINGAVETALSALHCAGW